MTSYANETNGNHLPRFHLKLVVFIFTCLMSTFFGGILYSQNLYETGKKKDIAKVLIGCGLWQLLATKLLKAFSITDATLLLFVPNIIGALVLTQLLWNYHFADIKVVRRRKIWFPLIMLIVIYGTLILLNVYD